jgi:uncharacterized membrane protein YoaK (UPF0700 family)
MSALVDAWRLIVPLRGDRHGPLSPLLLVLTIVTGLVDSFSYLSLGHVFVANSTGNVVFLAFALAGAHGFSIQASLLALAAFATGALAGGRAITSLSRNRGRLLAVVTAIEAVLAAAALAVALGGSAPYTGASRYVLIALLGMAMGLQNAAARKLAVPDLTTTVLTLTITGVAADSALVGGPGSRVGRRLPAVLGMLAGASAGALLVVSGRAFAPLAIALTLVIGVSVCTAVLASSNPPWTRATP